MSAGYESYLVLHGVAFPREPRRYYQKRRNKHGSGSAEWHGRRDKERRIQRAVAAYTPLGWKNWCAFALRLGETLAEG